MSVLSFLFIIFKKITLKKAWNLRNDEDFKIKVVYAKRGKMKIEKWIRLDFTLPIHTFEEEIYTKIINVNI